jgi:hypothetical protein
MTSTATAQHTGVAADFGCSVCGPLIIAAQDANTGWTRAQLTGRRTAAYRNARHRLSLASAAVVASKREHYGTAKADR